MSGAEVIALVAVISTAVVGIAGPLIHSLTERGKQQEQYRFSLYPERLTRYQEAVRHLVELQNVAYHIPPLPKEDRERFGASFRAADQWWTHNCLYLDPVSAEYLRKLIAEVGAWAVLGLPLRGTTPVPERFNEAWRLLWRGMGWKHADTNLPAGGGENAS